VVTPGESATTHQGVTKDVSATLRQILAQDFTSANVTVAGMIDTGHSSDRSDNKLADLLNLTLYCQQN
jgi:hypothetical protein